MGNSVVRRTVFRGSWWAKECRRDGREVVDVENIVQPPKERRERRAVEEVCSDGGCDGLIDMTVVDGGCDDAVGHQLVGSYYAEWFNAPEHVWRYFSEDAMMYSLVDVDGTRYVASGRRQLRELFVNVAAPETVNHEDDDGDCIERRSSSRW